MATDVKGVGFNPAAVREHLEIDFSGLYMQRGWFIGSCSVGKGLIPACAFGFNRAITLSKLLS